MGYNLGFGEFYVEADLEERQALGSVRWPGDLPPDAPLDSTGVDSYSNWIYPGYISWSDFTERHGLHEVFFNKNGWYVHDSKYGWFSPDGTELDPYPPDHRFYRSYEPREPYRWHDALIGNHPGNAALTEDHYQVFQEAQLRHSMLYDQAERSFKTSHKGDLHVELWDALRLNWLVYWTRQTLDTCECPTFSNS